EAAGCQAGRSGRPTDSSRHATRHEHAEDPRSEPRATHPAARAMQTSERLRDRPTYSGVRPARQLSGQARTVPPFTTRRAMILTVNSGSTSVKLGLFETVPGGAPRCAGTEHHAGRNLDAPALLGSLNAKLPLPPQAIAHRIVHGGTRFVQPVRIDSTVLAAIEELSPLAPLHNPPALRWVEAARALWPQVPQVAVFDTAFFAGLPRLAAEYALPARLGIEQGVRRYGFHGLAHKAMWHAWCELTPELPQGGRLITLQLGGGCSLAAIDQGNPLDTSMGFSPLEGLVMETRSGDADPAIIPYLERRLGVSGDEVVELLNTQSGLTGLSGAEGNPAMLLQNPAPQARFALELYCYRIRKYVGAYLAVLGGCDGI